ncbi:MAG TPA: hypothetical protein PKM59_15005 [Thermodesulfobacteriota bacterium]|mgnify:CR=1 FL=1|nr:hypothetical protein [Deltaproteobacteria bacterium]HNR14614.1 hypothetical protein [Thermodesulfobacteriota bacterium]HNU72807.1 hypothetical protein [Thermodesulfobacteriota bacterium]
MPHKIVFALLVFRVEFRGTGSQSEIVYSHDLDGFTFGDSSSGYWPEFLHDLPGNIREIDVTFIGNYE